MAILDNKIQVEREALTKPVADTEVEHIQGRSRCVEPARKTLGAGQFAQLRQLSLEGLR